MKGSRNKIHVGEEERSLKESAVYTIVFGVKGLTHFADVSLTVMWNETL